VAPLRTWTPSLGQINAGHRTGGIFLFLLLPPFLSNFYFLFPLVFFPFSFETIKARLFIIVPK